MSQGQKLTILKLLLLTLFIFVSANSFSEDKSNYITYIHPKPGSEFVTPQSSILIKINSDYAQEIKPNDFQFMVKGELSGSHSGETIISDNTIIFNPRSDYQTSEIVTVSFVSRIFNWKDTLTYTFTTGDINEFDPKIFLSVSHEEELLNELKQGDFDFKTMSEVTTINGVSVPSDFPHFVPNIVNPGISPGRLFLNNWIGTPYIMILENDGTPYFYQRVEDRARDFKVQPNGMLTRRYIGNLRGFVGMYSN